MHGIGATHNYISCIFFVSIVFIITWFLLNVVIGIINIEYQNAMEYQNDNPTTDLLDVKEQPHYELVESLKWKVYLSNKVRFSLKSKLSGRQINLLVG